MFLKFLQNQNHFTSSWCWIDRGPLRFTQLKEQVSASSTTVARRIKELEAHGLIVRSMNPAMPQSNLYALSEVGKKLSPVMQSLYEWAEGWTVSP